MLSTSEYSDWALILLCCFQHIRCSARQTLVKHLAQNRMIRRSPESYFNGYNLKTAQLVLWIHHYTSTTTSYPSSQEMKKLGQLILEI